MTCIRIAGSVVLMMVAGLWACGDDSDKPDVDSGTSQLDGSIGGDGSAGITIKSLTPERATLIVKMLQDVHVELSRPPSETVIVDVTSKDPETVGVVHPQLTFNKYDAEEMTTIEGLKLSNGQEVEIEFTIRGTGETKTFYAKVQKDLPDAGPQPD
jgi:hypothetical protein